MLRWCDSLIYAASGQVQARYPVSASIFTGFTHQTPGRTCVGSGAGVLAIPLGPASGAGSESFVLGFRTSITSLGNQLFASRQQLASIRGGGIEQVAVFLEPVGTTQVRLVAIARGPSREILRSSAFDPFEWVYLEIGGTIGGTGKLFFRFEGIENARVEFVATDGAAPGIGWSEIVLMPNTGNVGSLRISDLYLLDGVSQGGSAGSRFTKPLGPVNCLRALPTEPASDGWSPEGDGKFELVVLAGEINMNGRGSGTTGRWRSPNTKIPIWEKRGGPAAFRPLQAGVNTFGFFLDTNQPFWGPEMILAEQIAQLHEKGSAAAPNVRIVKLCQDSSTIGPFPGQEEYSWDPTAIGGLFASSVDELNQAVISLGGWGQINRIHWMWFQGERDVSYGLGYSSYINATQAFFSALISLASSQGVQLSIARVLASPNLRQDFFPQVEVIRVAQRSSLLPGDLVVFDDPVLSFGMFFDNNSLDHLGMLLFKQFLKNRSIAYGIDDYLTAAPVDNLYIERIAPGETSFGTQAQTLNSILMGVGTYAHYQGTSATIRTAFGPASVWMAPGTAGSWTPASWAQEGLFVSDDLPRVYTVELL